MNETARNDPARERRAHAALVVQWFVLALVAASAAAPAAHAQGAPASRLDLWHSGLPDAGAWIGEPGRAGWSSAAALGLGLPSVNAGHALGGWRFVDETRAPEGRPFPGLIAARAPLSGYDSLSVEPAGAGPGPAGALASVRPVAAAQEAGGAPRATFGLSSGDFGVDETSLTAERGSDLGRVHLEALAARRGIVGPYGEAARHRWGVGLGRRIGANDFSGTFRQAGLAARLLSGEEETARGASGRLAWRYNRSSWRSDFALSRQWDAHESFGARLAPFSRRDAQEVRLEAGVRRSQGNRTWGGQFDWNRARVARGGPSGFETRSGDEWGTAWLEALRPTRLLALRLGAGQIGGVDRFEFAPGARFEIKGARHRYEFWTERQLQPVWHDLTPGIRPFLQNTWVMGAGVACVRDAYSGALRVLAGRTRDRALISRLPLEEQWLRLGLRRDLNAWNFSQVWGSGQWRRGGLALGGEVCGLLRDPSRAQARVDPAITGRAFGEWGFRAFSGDLGLLLRLEADGVGARLTDEAAPRPLAAYATANAVLGFTLGDASVTLRMHNLEDGKHEEVWIDAVTGTPARVTPRELRLVVDWKFKN